MLQGIDSVMFPGRDVRFRSGVSLLEQSPVQVPNRLNFEAGKGRKSIVQLLGVLHSIRRNSRGKEMALRSGTAREEREKRKLRVQHFPSALMRISND
jgi:hypothetical protein